MFRKGLVSAAAAVLALGTSAWAADSVATPASSGASQVTLQPSAAILADEPMSDVPTPAAAPGDEVPSTEGTAANAPAATPIMYGLEQTEAGKWLADNGFNITGYAEGGYFHDFNHPQPEPEGTRTLAGDHVAYPGGYRDQIILDQVDIAISRTIDASKGFDVGFMVEGNYGRDSFYDHSKGILDENNKDGGGPDDQLDLEQAYITVGIPVGGGLTLTAGKFDALYGYETINPTGNQFYTHSYIYTYGTPLTQTGITATYKFNDELSATGGVSRGWGESTEDNNGAIDGIYQIVFKPSDKLTITTDGSVGPEGIPGTTPYGPSDNSNYWFVPELLAKYQVSDQLTVGADGLWGFANSYSQWYAAALYAGYTIDPHLTLNGRVEWYNDGGGLTTGVAGTTNYGEATVGLQIKPFPENEILQFLQFRPEVREDVADHSVFDGHANQLSAGIDAIMQF